MKTILKIARAELQTLFFSPIAWLILIVFVFQTAMAFCGTMSAYARIIDMGSNLHNVTAELFGNSGGLFVHVQQYLYLYIPLLTMGLMSREYSSGSIKLLYSSPVSNSQIIVGKYLSIMAFGLVLVAVLLIYVLYGWAVIKNFDYPVVLSGMLGLYLLLCAYGAIGLFMSAITSYQVVAAMGTLAVLAVLNFIGGVGQDIEFVRDLTYWLSIQGRCSEFVSGLICSEDLLYFLLIIGMFLMFSMLKLHGERRKSSWGVSACSYAGVVLAALFVGYLSSRPALMGFYDTTATKILTLTPSSQEIVGKVTGGLVMTTYDNFLDDNYIRAAPRQVNTYKNYIFKQYLRFKPDMKMKFVYYWDRVDSPDLYMANPKLTTAELAKKKADAWRLDIEDFLDPTQIREIIDLEPEGKFLVNHLVRESGESTFLRTFDDLQFLPMESEISAAFKHLTMDLPTVGFVSGHGERSSMIKGERGYNRFAQEKRFRYALINQGFDFCEVSLGGPVHDSIDILLIAEPRQAYTATEMANLDAYIARGGNLLLAGEPGREEFTGPIAERFGVEFIPGNVVRPNADFSPDLMFVYPTAASCSIAHYFESIHRRNQRAFPPEDPIYRRRFCIAMPGTNGLRYSDAGFTVTELFRTDSLGGYWNELQTTDFVNEPLTYDPDTGERMQDFVTALALERDVNGKSQRVIIIGDADCLSTGELRTSRRDVNSTNYTLILGSFYWLSNNEVPVDIRRPSPPDNYASISSKGFYCWKIVFMAVIPVIMLVAAILLWVRRRGR